MYVGLRIIESSEIVPTLDSTVLEEGRASLVVFFSSRKLNGKAKVSSPWTLARADDCLPKTIVCLPCSPSY